MDLNLDLRREDTKKGLLRVDTKKDLEDIITQSVNSNHR